MSGSPLTPDHTDANATMTTLHDVAIPAHFGDIDREMEAVRSGAGLIDLAQAGTASLSGPDARRFANGMFTNNIRDLAEGACNRSAMCDDRGRVQGLIDVHCTAEDRFDIVLEGVTAEWFEERYGLYIVFDDVEMTVSDEGPWILSVQGPNSAETLTKANLPTPEAGHHLTSDDGVRVARKDRSGYGGFDLVVPDSVVHTVWEQLQSAGALPVGHEALEALRIGSGIPRWPVDGTEKTLIHELGLNNEVCNFNKGCYLGQEVINRVDVKGQINKRITRIVMAAGTEAHGAAVLFNGKTVGTISSIAHSAQESIGLAVIRKSAWDASEVEVHTEQGVIKGTLKSV